MKRALKKKPIQIYIEPRQDHALETLARKKGISKAEIIRESLDRYFSTLPLDDDPAMALVGLGSSARTDLAEHHDAYLVRYARQKKP